MPDPLANIFIERGFDSGQDVLSCLHRIRKLLQVGVGVEGPERILWQLHGGAALLSYGLYCRVGKKGSSSAWCSCAIVSLPWLRMCRQSRVGGSSAVE